MLAEELAYAIRPPVPLPEVAAGVRILGVREFLGIERDIQPPCWADVVIGCRGSNFVGSPTSRMASELATDSALLAAALLASFHV